MQLQTSSHLIFSKVGSVLIPQYNRKFTKEMKKNSCKRSSKLNIDTPPVVRCAPKKNSPFPTGSNYCPSRSTRDDHAQILRIIPPGRNQSESESETHKMQASSQ